MPEAMSRRIPNQLCAFRSGADCLPLYLLASSLKKERFKDILRPIRDVSVWQEGMPVGETSTLFRMSHDKAGSLERESSHSRTGTFDKTVDQNTRADTY